MAKGDKKKMQNQLNTQVSKQQEGQDTMMNTLIPQANTRSGYSNQANEQSFADYNDIMGRYRRLADEGVDQNKPGLERVNYTRPGEMNEAFSGYRDFANTGGYSEGDVRDMRARGISPIRGAYANALSEVDRQKNLAGGYSPNAAALRARMASTQGQQMADRVQDVNAQIAEARNKGRQFGISGMGGLSVNDAELAQRAALANQNAGLEIARYNLNDPRMNAVSGMAQMFQATPGMAHEFAGQADSSMRNWMDANQLQQGIGQNAMQGQQAVAATPSNFETGFNRVGQGLQMAGNVAGAWMGVPGGKPKLPTNTAAMNRNVGAGIYGPSAPIQNSPYY